MGGGFKLLVFKTAWYEATDQICLIWDPAKEV